MAGISINSTSGIDPTSGFISYLQTVKPYHSKILETLVEYAYTDYITTTVIERTMWDITLSQANVDTLTSCGFGVRWDSPWIVDDYPTAAILSAVGETPISVAFLTDVNHPADVLVLNSNGYSISVHDPVTFLTTGTLPAQLSPGLVYYVISVVGNIIKVSKTIGGSPITFTTAGSGTISLHQENLKYNSFLVEIPPPTPYQCIAANVKSNQLAFIQAHNIIGVSPTNKTWTVSSRLLYSAYQYVTFGLPIMDSDPTGLVTNNMYYTTISVDGTNFLINVFGSTGSTYADLLVDINAQLIGSATAILDGGGIKITSSMVGYLSSVEIIDDHLFKHLSGYQGLAIPVNDTTVMPDTLLYVRNNPGSGVDGTYTIKSATLSGQNTVITVVESISPLAQASGLINIQGDMNTVPNWVNGTKVMISAAAGGTLPAPLHTNTTYYFIPGNEIGMFTLSTVPFPTQFEDTINITTLGTLAIDIVRIEPFFPGAAITVAGSYQGRNNGKYHVRETVQEGAAIRVYTLQPVPRTTPASQSGDGYMTVDTHIGYDYPHYCAVVQASELHADTFIGEKFTYELI